MVGCEFIIGYFKLESFFKQTSDQLYKPEIVLFRAKVRANLTNRIQLRDEHFIQVILDPNCRGSNLFNRTISTNDCVGLLNQLVSPNPRTTEQLNNNNLSQSIIELESSFNVSVPQTIDNVYILSYLNAERLTEYQDTAAFWKSKRNHTLFNHFKKYGCLVPAIVISERTFSKTSLIDIEKRSRLLDIYIYLN